MKKTKLILRIITMTTILTTSIFSAKLPNIALLDFYFEGATEVEAKIVNKMLRSELQKLNRYTLIDRSFTKAIIKEQAFQSSGVTEMDTAVKIGKIANVEYIAFGTLLMANNVYYIDCQLVDISSGLIVESSTKSLNHFDMMPFTIKEIAYDLSQIQLKKNNISDTGIFVKGKILVSDEELESMYKSEPAAAALSLLSLSLQGAIFTGSTYLPLEGYPSHMWTSIAMATPPLTVFYTKDWDIAPRTIGLSLTAGVFNFIGWNLLENENGSSFQRKFYAGLMLAFAGGGKLFSLIYDVSSSVKSVKKYNKKIRDKYTTPNTYITPEFNKDSVGLTISREF